MNVYVAVNGSILNDIALFKQAVQQKNAAPGMDSAEARVSEEATKISY